MPTRPVSRGSAFVIRVNYDLCHYCGACVAVCPPGAIYLHNSTLRINPHACTVCERCLYACPLQALALTDAAQGEVV